MNLTATKCDPHRLFSDLWCGTFHGSVPLERIEISSENQSSPMPCNRRQPWRNSSHRCWRIRTKPLRSHCAHHEHLAAVPHHVCHPLGSSQACLEVSQFTDEDGVVFFRTVELRYR